MQVWQVRTIISVININWNGFHSLSNIFIPSAKKNNFLANSGKFWQTLANTFFGKLWQTLFLANSKKKVIFCQSLPKTIFWQTLANSGKFWQTLANTFFGKLKKKVIFCQSLPYLPPR